MFAKKDDRTRFILITYMQGFDVPWWKKLLGAKLIGGKMDDITVIVAQVKTVVIPDDDEGGDVEEKVNE